MKLVSGEEIIAHVDPKEYDNRKSDTLVLYDPCLLKQERGAIMLTLWIIGSNETEHPIDKSDIMIRANPDKKFEDIYDKLIEQKYNNDMENQDENILDSYQNRYVISGPDSIN